MADIKLIVDVDGTKEVVTLNEALKGTTPAAKKAGDALTKAGNSASSASSKFNGARKNTNRFNATVQNAGFQINDFAVQVQSGQNALVAFSQQGAQLAGLLPGVAGAVTGLAVVLGASLLRSLTEGSDFMKSFAERAEATTTSIDQLVSAIDSLAAVSSLGGATGTMSFLGLAVDFRAEQAIKNYASTITKIRQDITGVFGDFGERQAGRGRISAEMAAQRDANLRMLDSITSLGFDPKDPDSITANLDLLSTLIGEFASEGGLRQVTKKREELISLGQGLVSLQQQELRAAQDLTREEEKREKARDRILGRAGSVADRILGSAERAVAQRMQLEGAGNAASMEMRTRAANALTDAMAQLAKETGQVSEADRERLEELQEHMNTAIDLYDQEMAKIEKIKEAKKELAEQEKAATAASKQMATTMVSGLKDVVNGTKTAGEAFRDMALKIIDQLLDIMIYQPLINSISGAMQPGMMRLQSGGGLFSLFAANGAAFASGGLQRYARGGVVNSPTYFGHSGGLGLMGEAGPEAILPLQRGPGGKLGVAGGGGVNITQNFNFSANGDESVKRIIANEAPKIAKYTQAEIVKTRQKGGSMRSTFG